MTIAVIKASLVVWFFMHVNHSSSLTRLFVFAGNILDGDPAGVRAERLPEPRMAAGLPLAVGGC